MSEEKPMTEQAWDDAVRVGLLRSIDACVRCAEALAEDRRWSSATTVRTVCMAHYNALDSLNRRNRRVTERSDD
jgi:hypothetical protein